MSAELLHGAIRCVSYHILKKLNPRKHAKYNPPRPSRLYLSDAEMAQDQKISQCNQPYKQTKRKRKKITSLDVEKAFDKIQHPPTKS